MENVFGRVGAHYSYNGFTYYMILWDIAPETTIKRVVAVIAHHPIVIHFKSVTVGLFAIDKDIVARAVNFVMLINFDGTAVQCERGVV